MYVEDVDDLDELHDLETELVAQLGMSEDVGDSSDEQIRWDLEDVRGRIEELQEGDS